MFFTRNNIKLLLIILISEFSITAISQNTVGTLKFNTELALDAYNLFYPNFQPDVFLINNCGQLINKWVGSQNTRPGFVSKLCPDGNLIKAMSSMEVQNFFGAGGSGGVLESRSWDNEILWQHIASDSIFRQHHDFELMPNGNIIYLCWKRLFKHEIVELGFDTINNQMEKLWFECVKEYSPELDSVIWEWCSDFHTVQDFDLSLANFGIVSESPDRININYQEYSLGREDWMHGNSVAYNQELDQIAISVRNFNEVWIIDHSTTTSEARTSSGGKSNRGGRILHRWGNPSAYNKGDSLSRKLFYPHNVKWIKNIFSEFFGQILVYNNVINDEISLGSMYETPIDENGNYILINGIFLPNNFTRHISHPDTTRNKSPQGSNIVLLENGNFFMQAATQGRGFELTENETVVWEYVIPLSLGEPIPQGTILNPVLNFNFSMTKYPIDYPGFVDKDLSPKGYLELDPNEEFCVLNNTTEILRPDVRIFPNPVFGQLHILSNRLINRIEIYDICGRRLLDFSPVSPSSEINMSDFRKGIYFVKLDHEIFKIAKL